MNPQHTLHAHDVVLATGNSAGVWAFVIGLVVVLILIGGFWLGFRRRSEFNRHPRPKDQPHKPEHQSHLEGDAESNETFPADGGRLLPHELGGHGEDVKPHHDREDKPQGPPPLA
ncbi:DUF6479 family protein [Streptomyces sp. 8L]|uniref:DUF6479 family protein n=1 Tax=Streptomyces sp. 8L TaxID=2877242 RepID=UPI001CD30B67|nr:DUF6479 family protein [Streptomyces sp. 8L]MCA1220895.1 DUF6479 family protein [Streptomyces sp. 8L]